MNGMLVTEYSARVIGVKVAFIKGESINYIFYVYKYIYIYDLTWGM